MALSHKYTNRPAVEEVINDPTVPKHYWRFRVHAPVEELMGDAQLTAQMQVGARGRGTVQCSTVQWYTWEAG